jgi:hypothetical protein
MTTRERPLRGAAEIVSLHRFQCPSEFRAIIGCLTAVELQKGSKSYDINDAGCSSLVACRVLDAITSFGTALTWPEAQHRIQAVLERGLQRDTDLEKSWPEVLGNLVETEKTVSKRSL